MREFSFDNFADAKTFVDEISVICEEQNHHADLHLDGGMSLLNLQHTIKGKSLHSISRLHWQLIL